jgi:hypothetical protein
MPRVLADLRLIVSSNFVGCMTGRSAGFSPFRTRLAYAPAFRWESVRLRRLVAVHG